MDVSGRRIAVTGAGGFIGGATCARLAADGARVVGIDAASSARPAVEAAGAAFVLADVADAEAIGAALAGCDGVVHAAALVGDRGTMAEHVRVNVRGTRAVLDAARAAGTARVVHVSTVATWGYDFSRPLHEDSPARATGAPYVDSKAAAQELALRRGAAVVRPGDVYGPRSEPWVLRPLRALRAGRFVLPGGGRGVLTPVHVDDLVSCLVRALVHPGAAGVAVTAWDGEPVAARDFFAFHARWAGRRRVRTAPRPALHAAAWAQEALARARGTVPDVTREALTYLSRPGPVPSGRAASLLGWRPQVSLAEGMRRTEDWLRREGLLS